MAQVRNRIAYILLVVFFFVTCLLVYVILFHRAPSVSPVANGGPAWRFKEDEPSTRLHSVPIILYHNLDGKGPFSLPSDILRAQFTMLREKNVGVISLADFISRLENPAPFQRPAVAITFDDGFLSMYTTLLPISMEFKYPITLFVYTDNIRHRAKKSLTWEQLREMEKKGISVESHTIAHTDLVKLQERDTEDSRRRLFEEIYLSKRIMQLYLDKSIRYFAFPYGRYNLSLIRLCEYAGYSRVFSTDYGSNVVTRDNFCLRRRHIKRDYTQEMIEKIIE